MSRISIDVTAEQHKKLKALAALQGKTIKEFVIDSTLGAQRNSNVDQDLAELEALLVERIRRAESETGSNRTVTDIFEAAYRDAADKRPKA